MLRYTQLRRVRELIKTQTFFSCKLKPRKIRSIPSIPSTYTVLFLTLIPALSSRSGRILDEYIADEEGKEQAFMLVFVAYNTRPDDSRFLSQGVRIDRFISTRCVSTLSTNFRSLNILP